MIGLQINSKLKPFGLRIPIIRLLKHDLSKFHFNEFFGYAHYYFGNKNQENYRKAWLHHLKSNDHHWEHYVDNYSIGMETEKCVENAKEMKDEAILEMAADWISAERTYKGTWPVKGDWKWAQEAIKKCGMHHTSRQKLCAVLSFLGFYEDVKEVLQDVEAEILKKNISVSHIKRNGELLLHSFGLRKKTN